MRSSILQPWLTVRGAATGVTSITQEAHEWLDATRFADLVFWVDVRETTTPSGIVQLNLETAPSRDDPLFVPMVPPITLAASTAPVIARSVRSLTTVSPSAWVRWRLSTTASTTGAWDATFRVLVAGTTVPFFAPTDLQACTLWVRADLGVTLNGTTVSAWADQSGSGNSFSQATGANQPTFRASSGINAKPALEFDGSTSYMQSSNNLSSFVTTTDFTWFVVFRVLSNTASGTTSSDRPALFNDTQSYLGLVWNTTTPTVRAFNWIGSDTFVEAGTLALTTNYVAVMQHTGGSLYIAIGNGAFNSVSSAATQSAANPVMIGRSMSPSPGRYINAQVAEMIVYNRALSAAEIVQVYTYLNAQYGV